MSGPVSVEMTQYTVESKVTVVVSDHDGVILDPIRVIETARHVGCVRGRLR